MTPATITGRWRVPWIEALPDRWQFLSAKRLFQTRPELASVDEPQLAATQAYGVIEQAVYEQRVGRKVTKLNKNLDKRRLVKRDDFVISMRSFEGGLERAWAEGGIRSSYIVLKRASEVSIGYYQHLFKSRPYIEALRATGNFIRDGQDLNYSNFSLVDLPYPPLEDQALIVRFLEWHGAMTGKLIRAKRRLIALLNEQKQSIVHGAVTRGLHPAAKLKPSGVGWLGDVPEHWEVRKLRSLFRRLGSGTTPSGDVYYGGGVPWVASGDLNNELVSKTQKTVTEEAVREVSSLRIYPAGSVMVAMYGATIGKTGILAMDACTNQACFVMAQPQANFLPTFCQLVLNAAKQALIEQSYGGGQPNINAEIVKSLKVPCPPIKEQRELEFFMRSELDKLNGAIALAKNEIGLIQEFRTRLIADVVTGQLDVRALAAPLPEVTEDEAADDLADEDEPEEDDDALIDAEEAA